MKYMYNMYQGCLGNMLGTLLALIFIYIYTITVLLREASLFLGTLQTDMRKHPLCRILCNPDAFKRKTKGEKGERRGRLKHNLYFSLQIYKTLQLICLVKNRNSEAYPK